jgi:hypothetical protein
MLLIKTLSIIIVILGVVPMISERIYSDKISIDQIINIILEQRIDLIFNQIYPEIKVNTATSSNTQKEDVA